MNVLQHTRNELNLCLKQNRPDRSYRDTLLKTGKKTFEGEIVLFWIILDFESRISVKV